jgi:hypothetical protein
MSRDFSAETKDSSSKEFKKADAWINLMGFANIPIHFDSFNKADEFIDHLATKDSDEVVEIVCDFIKYVTTKAWAVRAGKVKSADKVDCMSFIQQRKTA